MKKLILSIAWTLAASLVSAQQAEVTGPDSRLKLDFQMQDGRPFYTVSYDGKTMLEPSPLGFVANIGDFSQGLTFVESRTEQVEKTYTQRRIKHSQVNYTANRLTVTLADGQNRQVNIVFQVSDNDIAFRYEMPRYGETGSLVIRREATGFDFPSQTTTFLCPQSDPMIGWKRTKPSYEEEYAPDAPLEAPSRYGKGFTFPGLFRIGDDGWVLVSETGVDSRYCASRLSDAAAGGLFTVTFPMEEENNGNGTSSPGLALPGCTPWRTLTVGTDLAPIVETTVPWDVVEPRYATRHAYRGGKGTWSWILWQDGSINYDDQVRYINLAADMGFEYVLIDNWWDTRIGRERMAELVDYAHSRGVDVFLWYSSSGWWNDIEQGPTGRMDDPIVRKQEMRWLQSLGVKGIKVDFFGGDKQETMRLYEAILSDADDHGLMVIFHGCTLPRGWERMYPNYVGSEAVLASENLVFDQHFCDMEAMNACLHPFIRNTVGCMEFGGTVLNRRLNRTNDGGTERRTTDAFELATAVLFQNPVQNFALAPNNLEDAPQSALDFLRDVPTEWDETRFIAGYPGKFCVIARRKGSHWYIAAANGTDSPLKLSLAFPMLTEGDRLLRYADGKDGQLNLQEVNLKDPAAVQVQLPVGGGAVWVKK